MNAEFGWSIAIIVFALLVIGVAIALYVYWKDRSDYKKDGEIIVWSVAIAGLVLLLAGLGMMVWSISKRADEDVSERALKEQHQIVKAPLGGEFVAPARGTLPPPIPYEPEPPVSVPEREASERSRRAEIRKGKERVKKVRFTLPPSSEKRVINASSGTSSKPLSRQEPFPVKPLSRQEMVRKAWTKRYGQ